MLSHTIVRFRQGVDGRRVVSAARIEYIQREGGKGSLRSNGHGTTDPLAWEYGQRDLGSLPSDSHYFAKGKRRRNRSLLVGGEPSGLLLWPGPWRPVNNCQINPR